jgi:hypothetical protein
MEDETVRLHLHPGELDVDRSAEEDRSNSDRHCWVSGSCKPTSRVPLGATLTKVDKKGVEVERVVMQQDSTDIAWAEADWVKVVRRHDSRS